jgi:hypothetical protein
VQRLVDHWKRRSRALDNERFVFVVIAKNDCELRIVPGSELAWILKLLSGNEMTERVPTLLRKDQYYEALLTNVNRLSAIRSCAAVPVLAQFSLTPTLSPSPSFPPPQGPHPLPSPEGRWEVGENPYFGRGEPMRVWARTCSLWEKKQYALFGGWIS